MKKKLIFVVAAILLITGTTLTFAHSNLAASVSITAATRNPSIVQSVGGTGSEGVPNTVKLEYSSGSRFSFTRFLRHGLP